MPPFYGLAGYDATHRQVIHAMRIAQCVRLTCAMHLQAHTDTGEGKAPPSEGFAPSGANLVVLNRRSLSDSPAACRKPFAAQDAELVRRCLSSLCSLNQLTDHSFDFRFIQAPRHPFAAACLQQRIHLACPRAWSRALRRRFPIR